MIQMRSEHELLLRCSRANISESNRARIAALSMKHLDWSEFLNICVAHGLAPLVLRNAERVLGSPIPKPIICSLREEVARSAAKSLYLCRELRQIVEQLVQAGIPALAFKGPTLAVAAYGDLLLRSFADLDVLVSPSDAAEAKDVLFAMGYEFPLQLSDSDGHALLQSGYTYELRRRADGVQVELHWRLAPAAFGFRMQMAELWERRSFVEVAGAQIATLAPEDLLVVLCMHGAKHAWASLEGIVAIAELIDGHPELRWDVIRERAVRSGGNRMLNLGLLLARDLLQVTLPESEATHIRRDSKVHGLARQASEEIFEDKASADERHRTLRLLEFQLRAKDNFRDKLRFCFRTATTTTERDWAAAGGANEFGRLSWAVRPFRLVHKYGGWLAGPRS